MTSTEKSAKRMADIYEYKMSYNSLQEIHTLCGMVYTSRMNLPAEMITQSKKVCKLLIALRRIKP